MIKCPYDTCISNIDRVCMKESVVLEIKNMGDESLECLSYRRKASIEKVSKFLNTDCVV